MFPLYVVSYSLNKIGHRVIADSICRLKNKHNLVSELSTSLLGFFLLYSRREISKMLSVKLNYWALWDDRKVVKWCFPAPQCHPCRVEQDSWKKQLPDLEVQAAPQPPCAPGLFETAAPLPEGEPFPLPLCWWLSGLSWWSCQERQRIWQESASEECQQPLAGSWELRGLGRKCRANVWGLEASLLIKHAWVSEDCCNEGGWWWWGLDQTFVFSTHLLKYIYLGTSETRFPIPASRNKYLLSLIKYPEQLSWLFHANLNIYTSLRKRVWSVWEASEGGACILLCSWRRLFLPEGLRHLYLSHFDRKQRDETPEKGGDAGQLPTCFIGERDTHLCQRFHASHSVYFPRRESWSFAVTVM